MSFRVSSNSSLNFSIAGCSWRRGEPRTLGTRASFLAPALRSRAATGTRALRRTLRIPRLLGLLIVLPEPMARHGFQHAEALLGRPVHQACVLFLDELSRLQLGAERPPLPAHVAWKIATGRLDRQCVELPLPALQQIDVRGAHQVRRTSPMRTSRITAPSVAAMMLPAVEAV